MSAVIGVAVAVPAPFGVELQALRARYGDPLAGSIPTHITLLPPTTVDVVVLPEIEQHLDAVAAVQAPYDVRLSGTGTFRPVSPVVFVALAEGISGCEQLEARVRSGVLARPVQFPYHPHVTVAHDLSDAVLDRAFADLADYSARFTVDRFLLFEHSEGAWHPRRDFPFRAPHP